MLGFDPGIESMAKNSVGRCYAGLLNQAVPTDNCKKAAVFNKQLIKEEPYGNNNPAANEFILGDGT